MRFASLALLVLAVGCDAGPGDPGADGGADASDRCSTDDACDDGVFCNGAELCLPRSPLADARGCAPDTEPCAAGTVCDEAMDRCALDCDVATDADGDGADSPDCGGLDCDDHDARRHPGATEICDPDGLDEDCDPSTFGTRDLDADGYVDARCCNGAGTAAQACGDDCADEDATRHPTEAETCNELDDDCDGVTDEMVTTHFVRDADRDGHGDRTAGAEAIDACRPASGFAPNADDCDDAVGSIHPGAYDRCDPEGVDDDCSGTPNDPPGGCSCSDGSTRACALPGLCASGTQTCTGGTWPTECSITALPEVCGNGLDEDCDGSPDDGCVCDVEHRFCGTDVGACMRGLQVCTTDGEWTACTGAVDPSPEVCNEIDDDCDGVIDDGVFWRCFQDTDGDGYAVPTSATMELCAPSCPSGWTANDPADPTLRDCGPTEPLVHPGAAAHGIASSSVGFDYDCDGVVEIASVPALGCTAGAGGGCAGGGGGLRSVGSCGARADLYTCVTMDHGSGILSCDEIIVCAAASNACGDDNRTKCR